MCLCLTGNLRLKNFQGFSATHFYTNVFVAHRMHGSLKLASDLGIQVSQEIPGYPQAFQESWKFSHGLTQTHRGKVLTAPDGPRMHVGIHSVGPLCVLGVQEGAPWGIRGPLFLSEEEPCLLGTLPSSQHLQTMFVIPASEHTAGRKRQQESLGSSGHQPCAPCPHPECIPGRRVSRGEEREGQASLTVGFTSNHKKLFTISIIPGREPHCRKTDSLLREEERWGLVRV